MAELIDFIITKTTVETLGIQAASLVEANKAAQEGGGDPINVQTNINVRPRPTNPGTLQAPTSANQTAKTTVNRPAKG